MILAARLLRSLLSVTLLLACASAARAQTGNFENLDRIDSLVAMTMGAGLREPGGAVAPVDRRLRLAACPQTPQVDGPAMGAAIVSCPAIGWRLRVPLVPAVPVDALAAPSAPGYSQAARPAPATPVIKKGDPVQLVAGDGSFSVSRLMIAEENGVLGAQIRVREDARTPPVNARVEGPGIVRIPGI